MRGMENFKIQEAMSVFDPISLNRQGDSIVCLLSTLRGEDCKRRKSCLSNAAVQSVIVKHVRWNLQSLREYGFNSCGAPRLCERQSDKSATVCDQIGETSPSPRQ
jgi:hypothetical protein